MIESGVGLIIDASSLVTWVSMFGSYKLWRWGHWVFEVHMRIVWISRPAHSAEWRFSKVRSVSDEKQQFCPIYYPSVLANGSKTFDERSFVVFLKFWFLDSTCIDRWIYEHVLKLWDLRYNAVGVTLEYR